MDKYYTKSARYTVAAYDASDNHKLVSFRFHFCEDDNTIDILFSKVDFKDGKRHDEIREKATIYWQTDVGLCPYYWDDGRNDYIKSFLQLHGFKTYHIDMID